MDKTIKVLNQIDHVRQRPTTYIGENETPFHLVTEILDNSLDELVNNYADTVEINIDNENHIITISDNGRGIPIHELDVNGNKMDSIIAIATELFSSSKFDRKHYDIAIGQNGIGLTVVNFLSERLLIKTNFNNGFKQYHFIDGKFLKSEFVEQKFKGTEIIFVPDKKYFNSLNIDINIIKERFELIKTKFHDKKLIFNKEEIKGLDFETYVKNKLNLNKDNELFKLNYTHSDKSSIQIFFTYDNNETSSSNSKIIGDVNLKFVEGKHYSTIQTFLISELIKYVPKNFIIDKYDLTNKLRIYVSLMLPEPKFNSQDKYKLISDIKYLLTKSLEDNIEKIYKSSEFLKNKINSINENKILKSNKKHKTAKKRKSFDNPIKDCLIKPGKRLYILEGESALGTLVQIRNSNNEAIFPLQGKIINVYENTLDKILKNDTVNYLFEVLGITNLNEEINDIEYKEIIFLTDSDADGGHISCLLESLLYKFIPNIIKQKRVKILFTPLYAITDSKNKIKFIYSITPPELKNGERLTRFKGIGELNPDQLLYLIENGKYYTLEYCENEEEIKKIFDTNYKIKLINNLDLSIEKLYESIS